jgi:hypothetical protein
MWTFINVSIWRVVSYINTEHKFPFKWEHSMVTIIYHDG